MKFTAQSLLVFTLSGVAAFAPSSIKNNNARSSTTALNMASNDNKKRVVVTGLGVISGCGIGHDDFFQACIDGKSSIAPVTRFDATNYPCTIASEVPDAMFDPNNFFVNPKNIKSNDRYTHFAVAAARQALKDAQLGNTPETLENPERIGVMIGTAFGGMETFERETLKLAKKPERPKVCLLLFVSCLFVSLCTYLTLSHIFLSPRVTHHPLGFTLYYPCTFG
jgi:3-oxoacyl-[acyl-carrier-protein] synthase II